ncbi:CGNR zinc finger domain-containing protein [Paenibacillus sp. 7541]|uniref:CGNR zinc finger domain-containing protein n=1 Tax=Paenibacillus sp. 7541 TaxID=2026236 RepID=UPI000BA5EA98|nr:CGNR zinc finger domain-containing protein [Paenibacillus sp. 7541]PAK50333.1 hypothetical protein CHH75_18465 [Paenibacillus sp. 7541]
MEQDYQGLEIIADFINTYDRRMRYEGDPGTECWVVPEDLKHWLQNIHYIAGEEPVSESDLALARKLRAALRDAIELNPHDRGPDVDVEPLEKVAREFKYAIRLEDNGDKLEPLHQGGKQGLGHVLALVYEMRRKGLWRRIRVCSAPDCQWVFIDRSRPGTGKWCLMSACGNRAKNRAYRERSRVSRS